MKTRIKLFAIVCGLLLMPLIPLQAQSVGDYKITINQLNARIKKLEDEKQAFEKQLKKCQKKNSGGNCSELQDENDRLKEEVKKLEADLAALSSVNSSENKTALDIKDPAFKAHLLHYCDMDNDGVITTWDAEHTYVIDCSHKNKGLFLNSGSQPIYSLEGIEAYKNLKKLICSGNEIRIIDLSHNPLLETVEVDGCSLKVLKINENTDLKRLSCKNNALRELDINNNPNLTFLDVSDNELNVISLNNNPNLTELYCANNGLVSIMASNNVKLEVIDCSNNMLNSLDLSNTAVDSVMCQNNSLTFLDLRNERTISYLDCTKNKKLEKVLISPEHFVVTDKNKKIRYENE